MKKLLLVVLCIFSVGTIFGEEKEGNIMLVTSLIEDDLKGNYLLIAEEAQYLTDVERYSLYNSNEQSGTVPFLLNSFLGLGIGSFVQGDMLGGGIGLGGELGGIALMASGDSTLILSGAVMVLGTRIFEIIRPWTYASSFNKDLKRALGVVAINYEFVPSFDLNAGKPIYVASIKIDL